MNALILIKQAEDNNSNGGGISPLAATGLTAGGVGVGAGAMALAKNQQINDMKAAANPMLKTYTRMINNYSDQKLGEINKHLGLTGDKAYTDIGHISDEHLEELKKSNRMLYNSVMRTRQRYGNINILHNGGTGGFFHNLGKALRIVK